MKDSRLLLGRLGRFGVWVRDDGVSVELAQQAEAAGFSAIWVGRAPGDLRLIEELLAATTRLTVATGILNIWTTDPTEVARSVERVEGRHPGRLVLGIGAGHAETIGARYARPYSAIVSYLDELDRAGLPASRRMLAALGPRMLALARDRAAGALPYLVTPSFTRQARSILGPDAVLAPDQKVILTTDPQRARGIVREKLSRFLGFANYRANLSRMGFTGGPDDMDDQVIRDLFPWGEPTAVVARIKAQLDAGADHVAVQVILGGPDEDLLAAYRTLGEALELAADRTTT